MMRRTTPNGKTWGKAGWLPESGAFMPAGRHVEFASQFEKNSNGSLRRNHGPKRSSGRTFFPLTSSDQKDHRNQQLNRLFTWIPNNNESRLTNMDIQDEQDKTQRTGQGRGS